MSPPSGLGRAAAAFLGVLLALPEGLGQGAPAAVSQPPPAAARPRPAAARPRPAAARPRPAAARCDSSRYGCVGQKPADYDRDVQQTLRPTAGMDTACLARLRQAKVSFRMLKGVKGVRTPVEVLSQRLGGVLYRKAWNNKRRFILDCRLVEALVVLGRDLRRAGVAGFYFSSSWRYTLLRGQSRLSQHAYGLAIDLVAIDGAFGYATVVKHYEKGVWGCGERNKTPKGAVWRKLHCALSARRAFAQIFTPDTDGDHRDHWHLEQPNPALRLPAAPAVAAHPRTRSPRRPAARSAPGPTR